MNSKQVALVQDSFNQLRPAGDFIAAIFYRRLFEVAPEAKQLFKQPVTVQYAALMRGLSIAVSTLDDPDHFVSYIHALARAHYNYGVTPAYYETAVRVLLDTLQTGLGNAFTDELRDAWTAACIYIFAEMKRGIAQESARPESHEATKN
jgi:hemoglobin-like flavoprotein